MSASLYGALSLDAPFPGLRAFESEESLLFYGREVHVAELLDRLGDSHFMAVIGTSGSGKSSLVRAGLRPALQRGYLVGATSRWRFATMRPGSAPIQAMAKALAETCQGLTLDEFRASLYGTSAGLSEAVAGAGLAAGESLLIIADQFEELFRFDMTPAQQGEASLFVSQLLEATERRSSQIYVVVTMRSEFLGRCSEFPGLAEAFNRSQYLVPRLTRDERRQAIERPLRLFGTEPAPALVQEVLNDAGDDPDQLPVMQHVLLRTYREWQRLGGAGRLDRQHYEKAGRIEGAINDHGEEILKSVDGLADRVAERLFRSLTVKQGGVSLRRPRVLSKLYEICEATTDAEQQRIDTIVKAFADRHHAFLMLSTPALSSDTVVDITHESVIRKWKRLADWVRDESRSSQWYVDLARDVERYKGGTASLWQDPELSGILQRQQNERWNEAWANQYRRDDDPTFADVLSFLNQSETEQNKRHLAAEEQRNRELRQAKALSRSRWQALIVLTLLLVFVGIVALLQYRLISKDTQIQQATAQAKNLLDQNQGLTGRLGSSESDLARLRQRIGSAGTATDEQTRQLRDLTAQIAKDKDQLQKNDAELNKYRKDQDLTSSDRGAMLSQINTLQQQLAAMRTDRDRLQTQLNSQPTTDATLQRQLAQERTRADNAVTEVTQLKNEIASLHSGSGSAAAISINGTADRLAKLFADAVGNYELGDFDKAASGLWTSIAMRPSVKQPVTPVTISGTRTVPFAPASYLAVTLVALKADCAAVAGALKAADSEPAPPRIADALKSARMKCGGK